MKLIFSLVIRPDSVEEERIEYVTINKITYKIGNLKDLWQTAKDANKY